MQGLTKEQEADEDIVYKTIKELNISNSHLNADAAKILAEDIQDNGALASLDISGNHISSEQAASIGEDGR